MLTQSELDGLKHLHRMTRGTCDAWDLAGPGLQDDRRYVMASIAGKKLPLAKCGVTALRAALNGLARREGLVFAGNCQAARQQELAQWVASKIAVVA